MTTSHKHPRPLLKMTVLEFSIAFNLFYMYFSDHLMQWSDLFFHYIYYTTQSMRGYLYLNIYF